jgi:hypothetical protein
MSRTALVAARAAEKAALKTYLLAHRQELADEKIMASGTDFLAWLKPVLNTAHGIEINAHNYGKDGTLVELDVKARAGLDVHRAVANLLVFHCEVEQGQCNYRERVAYTRLHISYN